MRQTRSVIERIRERREKRHDPQPGPSPATPRVSVSAKADASAGRKFAAGSSPTAWRIAGALGTTPAELAVVLGVQQTCIDDMFKGTSGQSAIAAGHPAWVALGRLVDAQIGLLMGVKAEIEGKRELDAKRLRERMERAKR